MSAPFSTQESSESTDGLNVGYPVRPGFQVSARHRAPGFVSESFIILKIFSAVAAKSCTACHSLSFWYGDVQHLALVAEKRQSNLILTGFQAGSPVVIL